MMIRWIINLILNSRNRLIQGRLIVLFGKGQSITKHDTTVFLKFKKACFFHLIRYIKMKDFYDPSQNEIFLGRSLVI